MLYGSVLKSIITGLSTFFYKCSIIYNRSLRAQKDTQDNYCRFGASFFASCRASVTVEAALILPVFLYAVCGLIGIGQLLRLEGKIHFASSQAVKWYAGQKAVAYYYNDSKEEDSLSPADAFSRCFREDSFCSTFVEGGKKGIRLRVIPDKEQRETLIFITAYSLRIPLPLVESFHFSRKIFLRQRIPSGYIEKTGCDEEDNRIVYLARNGAVYHTHADCSYIYIRISNQAGIQEIIRSSGWKPCAHCIRKGKVPNRVYITAGGSHYHSRMSCSGLKRTIRAVPYREVRGMRKCSRCIERDQ